MDIAVYLYVYASSIYVLRQDSRERMRRLVNRESVLMNVIVLGILTTLAGGIYTTRNKNCSSKNWQTTINTKRIK